MVDPVIGRFEQAQLYGPPTASCCQQIFGNTWLTCYPRPREIGFNNGGELKAEFKELCTTMDLIEKTSLPWNPQSKLNSRKNSSSTCRLSNNVQN